MSTRPQAWLVALVLLLAATTVAAASSAPGTVDPRDAEAVAAFAKQVERQAAARGARVVLVARVGRATEDLPPGIEYTHVGIGVYSDIPLGDGRTTRGYVFHNLYQREDKPFRSTLVEDTAFDFFAGVTELRAGVVVPVPELQQRLLEALADGTFERLHNPRYSAISNPFDTRYQNCTEHLLDLLNAVVYRTEDVAVLKRRAREWFEPTPLQVEPGRLRLASIFLPDVALSDHAGVPATATYGSLLAWMQRFGLAADAFTVTP